MKKIFLIASFLFTHQIFGQVSGWDILGKVKFSPKFFDQIQTDLLVPIMDAYAKSIDSKEITIKGYYIPIGAEHSLMIISKFPYRMCFFCGGAGPDSVIEVHFPKGTKMPTYPTDKLVKVKGKLKINRDDLEKLNFVLYNATEIKD
jgi:hypothetical protein